MQKRIGLIGENSIEYISKLLDIWNTGSCAVLIDWWIPIEKAVDMMREACVNSCYIDENVIKSDILEYSNISFNVYENKIRKTQILSEAVRNKYHVNDSVDEAVIIYSSGTTGEAKGIILTHYAINTNADAVIEYMKPCDADCIYIVKTLSHSSTLTGELLVGLKTGMNIIISNTLVPSGLVYSNIQKYDVSILCVNPTLLNMYLNAYNDDYSLKSLEKIYVSGSILNDKLYNKSGEKFENIKIFNVYGLSEAGPRVTAQTEKCKGGNSVGKPIHNVKVKITDTSGNELNNGEYGLINVLSPSIFKGYVTGDKNPSVVAGWLNTGDIGYIDEYDELHVIGRSDDVIILHSHKIYPSDVQTVLLSCTEMEECVVAGNEETGIVCYYTSNADIDYRSVYTKCKDKLMPHEIPKKYRRVSDIPKNMNGKVDLNLI